MPSKDYKKVIKEAERQGWRFEDRKGGHVLGFPPDKSKSIVTIVSTPSTQGSFVKFLADMKRSGLRWPPPSKGQK